MPEQEKPTPNGLVTARNVLAVVGAGMLILGLFTLGSDAWQVPLWAGMLCLVVAAAFALNTTKWRSMPLGARVVILIAVGALVLVAIDLVSSAGSTP